MRRKGRIIRWITGLLIPILLCGCSGSYTCTDLLASASARCGGAEDLKIYFSGGTDLNRLSEERAGQLYDGMDPTSLCDDYAICLSRRDSVFEIHIYRSSATNRTAELSKILQRRIELLQSPDVYLYDPEGYEEIVNSAAVYSKGKYVCLLVTPDNDAVWKEIKGRI